MNEVKVGTYTGNGAAKNIECGFKPDYVRVVNITDGDITHEWFRTTMAEGTSVDTAAAVAPNADNGVSTYSGSTTVGEGFTIGTDLSENAKVYGYFALRNAD
jgi:hypothetical protein